MVIYDVYEELEKPDEHEILFINKILDGSFEFSSYENLEDIFHPSCNNKIDNCDVIIDGGSCVNVATIDINIKSFAFDVDAKSHESNLYVVSFESDLDHNSFEFDMDADFVKLFTNDYQIQKGGLIVELYGCLLFYKNDVHNSYRRARIEYGSDWKIRCKMKRRHILSERT